MTLMDWLRRLGILRFGGEAAVYHNAKERPINLQMDNVFDSTKDVIDLNQQAATPPQPKQSGKGDSRSDSESAESQSGRTGGTP